MRAPARLRTALRTAVAPLVAVAVCLAVLPADAAMPRERNAHRAVESASPFLSLVTAPAATSTSASGGSGGSDEGASRATRWGVRADAPGAAARWTGFAFDACRAPSSAAMDRWRVTSPFLGVGIYIGGALRACAQRHLTAGWVDHQTGNGWKLLPIWVGPQASCTSYHSRISARPGARHRYPRAQAQGVRAARGARAAAYRLGIARGSTLWYDLEWFPTGNAHCRKAALHFLSAWTEQLHRGGYRSGVYSSVSAGIAVVGRERGNRRYTAPDQVWFAWANGRRDVSWTKYLRAPRWRENHRVHQYALDVSASYGGVRMAIDRNFVDLGTSPQVRRTPAVCGRSADRTRYARMHRGDRGSRVRVAQCLLRELGHYRGDSGGAYGSETRQAVRSFQHRRGLRATGRTDRRTWTALLAAGPHPVLKRGSEGPVVRRLQRALTAALPGSVPVQGYFGPGTASAVARYQTRHGLRVSGVASPGTWHALRTGAPEVHRHHGKGHHGNGHHAGRQHHGKAKHGQGHHAGKQHHKKHGGQATHKHQHQRHKKHGKQGKHGHGGHAGHGKKQAGR
ncbi:MAG TPA: glycoside hydrolase domain-containing protein [Streptomyces sp.]|nr:glycoside hydrolase domain-containing protein [Streptomyces sp.]